MALLLAAAAIEPNRLQTVSVRLLPLPSAPTAWQQALKLSVQKNAGVGHR